VEPSSNDSYGFENLQMTDILPKIKMKDFFLDIVKMFNLVVVDNPNVPNNLIIEPREDYFRSKRKVRDWDDILDNSSEIIISPMAEVDASTYIFTYKEDTDFYNEQYTDETKLVYGALKLYIQNDFSYEENKLEVLFSPTPDSSQFIGDVVAPFFAEMSTVGKFKSKKVKPRILFYTGTKDLNPVSNSGVPTSFRFKDYESQPNDPTYQYTEYPYTGMWDDPYNPQYDLGFGRVEKVYWNANKFPVNNLYEQFHRYTIDNVIDIDAKILEATFHLTPKEVEDFDFRDVVFLRGQYWRVMKISDYNPAGADSLTKVTLYKVIDFETYNENADQIGVNSQPCPTDVIAIRKGAGTSWYYVSASGLPVTSECCSSLGGSWYHGRCVAKEYEPTDPVGPYEPVGPLKPSKFPYGGNGVIITPEPYGPVVLRDRNNTINSPTANINGRNNFISRLTENITVFGNNNSVNDGVKNTVIVGDNISARESNSIYLGNIRIDENGNSFNVGLKVIDGGKDEVFPVTKTNDVDIIDGTYDSTRNPDGDFNNRVIIDGEDDSGVPE
jgi:hypothetical protein